MIITLPSSWRRAVLIGAAMLLLLGLATRVAWMAGPLQDLVQGGSWMPPSPLVGRAWILLSLGILATAWSGRRLPARAVGLILLVIAIDRTLDLLGYPAFGLVRWLQRVLNAMPSSPLTDVSPVGALSLAGLSAALALRPLPCPGSRRDAVAGAILLFLCCVLVPLLVGRAYGSPWAFGGLIGRVSATMLAGMLTAVATEAALGGPAGFPMRIFVGNASRSVLLRTFVPLALVVLLLLAVFEQFLLPRLGIPPASAGAVTALFVLLIAVIAAMVGAHLVGTAADRSDAAHLDSVTRLDAAQRRLRAILDAVPMGVVVVDPDGRMSLANREAERIIGPGPHDAEASEWPARYGIFLPDGVTPVPASAIPLARALRGESVVNLEAVIRRPGTTDDVPVQASATPIPSSDDRPQGAVMVFRDVKARKLLEDRARAAQRLEAVGQLAGGIAHDFNNLLTVILGHAELLLDRMPPEDPNRRSIVSMEESARRAALLTRRLLAFSRKQLLQPRRVDLRELLSELSLPLRDAAAPDLRIEILPSPEPVYVQIDRDRLSESLVSLVLNSREAATRPGLLQVSVESGGWTEPQRVGMDLLPAGRYVRLAVRDDGPGMPADVLARVLEPFFTTKPKHLGSGLGLSTVYGFVRQSGGGLAIESVMNWGTTVVIWLPSVDAPVPVVAPKAAPAPAVAAAGPRTMLLAEDEPAIRDMTAAFMESAGWTVLRATDGRDALVVAGRYRGEINLLVTDIMMPHLGGVDLARQLRAARPGMRVLFISGFTDTAPAGGDHFLAKPFSPAELLAAVQVTAGDKTKT